MGDGAACRSRKRQVLGRLPWWVRKCLGDPSSETRPSFRVYSERGRIGRPQFARDSLR
jgi:hypothetical protein